MGPMSAIPKPVTAMPSQVRELAPRVEKAIETAKHVANRQVSAVPEDALTATFRQMQAPEAKIPENTHLTLAVDEPTGRVIGRIVDAASGDVVRQIPSEEMLELIAKTKELFGQLVNEKV